MHVGQAGVWKEGKLIVMREKVVHGEEIFRIY